MPSDVVRVLQRAGDLGEEFGHLLAGEVDGGHDHVRRAFVAELDDPFAQVGLRHLEAFLFQVVVEEGLLRGHGLALDDLLDPVVFGDAAMISLASWAVLATCTLTPAASAWALNASKSSSRWGMACILALGDLLHQGVHIHAGKGLGAAFRVGHGEVVHGGAQELVVQGPLQRASCIP